MLTGKHPFDDKEMSITRAILEKKIQPITEILPNVNTKFSAICEKMLAKERKKR